MLTFGRTEEIQSYPKRNKNSNWNGLKTIDPENSHMWPSMPRLGPMHVHTERKRLCVLCVNNLFNRTDMRPMLHVEIW